MPRFTLRELFLATTLIGVGVGGFFSGMKIDAKSTEPGILVFLRIILLVISVPTACAGVGALFQRKFFGALVGAILMLAATLFLPRVQ